MIKHYNKDGQEDFEEHRQLPGPLTPTQKQELQPVYAEVVTFGCFLEALDRVRGKIPPRFWKKFHENLTWYAQADRNRKLVTCIKQTWPEYRTQARGLKFFSYFGAVKAHPGIPDSKMYDRSGQMYADLGNQLYTDVLFQVWPGCLPGMSNKEKLGDVLEAFLGFCWFMSHPDNTQSHLCHRQLQIADDLHKVMAYLSDHRDEWPSMGCWL